jgi:hypothetical protein
MKTFTWVNRKDSLPERDGWYMVRDKEYQTTQAMYFREKKRSYGDSQWYTDSQTGHSWQCGLYDQWLYIG